MWLVKQKSWEIHLQIFLFHCWFFASPFSHLPLFNYVVLSVELNEFNPNTTHLCRKVSQNFLFSLFVVSKFSIHTKTFIVDLSLFHFFTEFFFGSWHTSRSVVNPQNIYIEFLQTNFLITLKGFAFLLRFYPLVSGLKLFSLHIWRTILRWDEMYTWKLTGARTKFIL